MNLPRWNSTARVLGFSALVFALTMTADSGAHSLYVPARGSELHACPLRGSRGSSETVWAISGAARFTAHGSGADVLGAALVGVGAGCAVAGATAVVLASGVVETVESPAPQPATSSGAAAIQTHFTDAHPNAI